MFAATILKSKLAAVLLVSAVGSACTLDTTSTVGTYPAYSTDLGYAPATYSPDYGQAYTPAPAGNYTPTQYAPNPYPTAPTQYQTYAGQDQTYAEQGIPLLNEQQLDQLAAPIALYPDPLIAVILPASTYPDEIAAAASLIQYNSSDSAIEAQPWDPSVKALAHSPSILMWMNNNPDWTSTLGTAFTYQSQDVMSSIQRLRAQAVAAGSLYNTPQQQVVYEDRNICVVPAQPNVVYVPVYDWNVAYTRRYQPTFYAGASIGFWFSNDCDWNDRYITVGARWDRGWDHRWDHDRDAHNVVVRNYTSYNNNNRDGRNNRIADDTRNVKVGGTQWKRDDARPRPTLPSNVTPASRFPASSGRQLGTVKIPDARTLPQERNASRAPTPVAPPTERPAERRDFPRDTSRLTQPQTEAPRTAQPSRNTQAPRVEPTPPANRIAPRVTTPDTPAPRVAAPAPSGNLPTTPKGTRPPTPRLGTTPLPPRAAPQAQERATPRVVTPAPTPPAVRETPPADRGNGNGNGRGRGNGNDDGNTNRGNGRVITN